MRKFRMLVCLTAVLALSSPAMGFLPLVDIEGAIGVWRPSPSGAMGTKGDPDLDIKRDFPLGGENELFGRLRIEPPLVIPNLYFMGNPTTLSDSVTGAFTFTGKDFQGDLDTELQLNHYDLALYYNVPFLKMVTLDRLSVDVGLNCRYVNAEASVSDAAGGKATASMSILIPQLYLGARFQPVKRFSLEAEARALTYMGDRSYSLLGRLKATVFGPLFVAGGYRYDEYDISKGGLNLNFTVSGPFIEAGLSL